MRCERSARCPGARSPRHPDEELVTNTTAVDRLHAVGWKFCIGALGRCGSAGANAGVAGVDVDIDVQAMWTRRGHALCMIAWRSR